jgi:hypothetical protein
VNKKMGYDWRLRQVMADRGLFATGPNRATMGDPAQRRLNGG